jgi:stage V sporulation protein SpoVS
MELNEEKLAEVAEYIGLTDEIIATQQEKIASLQGALSTANQKEASSEVSALDADLVAQTVSNSITAGFLEKAGRDQAIAAIMQNPAHLLEFVDKLATTSIKNRQVKPVGKPVQKTASASNGRESDAAYEQTFSRLANRI